jgi:hypothetical protein
MIRHQISQVKMNIMRKRFIDGTLICINATAKELKVSPATVFGYKKEFQLIKEKYPDHLLEMDFYIPEPKKAHRPTEL